MNDPALWARVVQARTERDDLRPQRVWTLRKGEHAAAIDVKAVPGIGAEIVLTVDSELRQTRLFRSHEQAELVGAIADTRAMFEGRGGREMRGSIKQRYRGSWSIILDLGYVSGRLSRGRAARPARLQCDLPQRPARSSQGRFPACC